MTSPLLLLAVVVLPLSVSLASDHCAKQQQHPGRRLLCALNSGGDGEVEEVLVPAELDTCAFIDHNGTDSSGYYRAHTSRVAETRTGGSFKLNELLPRDAIYNISCCPGKHSLSMRETALYISI